MKFICDKYVLMNAINTSIKAVPSKSTISSMEGLLIKADRNVTITGYDLKKAIYTEVEADVTEAGTAIINARLLSEMVRRMPEGNITVFCDQDHNTKIKCGRSEYNFKSLDLNEYPELPKFDGLNNISIPEKLLKNMINKTIFAVAKDEIRPIYTGTLFEIRGNELTLVSVDGFRLAKKTEIIENSKLEDCSFVVPGFALSDIEKICEDEDGLTEITIGEKHISFKIRNTVVISRRLDGDFLNYRNAIPSSFKSEIEVEKQEMISVIDRVSLMLSEKNRNPVKMTFGEGVISCLCVTPGGKAEDECICIGNGENLMIGFNDRYVADALKAAEGERIKICINTASSPCVIKPADSQADYIYMILPVRVH